MQRVVSAVFGGRLNVVKRGRPGPVFAFRTRDDGWDVACSIV